MTRRHVKVALSGDVGDEAFGGYARYAHDLQEAAMRRRLPAWFRRAALGPLARASTRRERRTKAVKQLRDLTLAQLEDGLNGDGIVRFDRNTVLAHYLDAALTPGPEAPSGAAET